MKILHTADWHIGATLCGRRRYDEYEAFLTWLAGLLAGERYDLLVVCGDIFDTTTPSNRALELYYRFLGQVVGSGCGVVITAGNHDSPSLLAAPKELLRSLDIHIIGSVPEDPEEEILLLNDRNGNPGLILCAVPFLRDRDIRVSVPGETEEEKMKAALDGIGEHYRLVADQAASLLAEAGGDLPVMATGHLFAAGSRRIDGDGVRDIWIGGCLMVDPGIFPEIFRYVALGHLHQPQVVGASSRCRYPGSPLPVGFSEAGKEKSVLSVLLTPGHDPVVVSVPVPSFRHIETVSGLVDEVMQRLCDLKFDGTQAYLEIVFTDDSIRPGIPEDIREMVAGSGLEVLRVKGHHSSPSCMTREDDLLLEDLSETEVFRRCLHDNGIVPGEQDDLMAAFYEILTGLHEDDVSAQ